MDHGLEFDGVDDFVFAGFGHINPAARNVEQYETILSGDLSSNDIDAIDPCDLLGEPTRSDNGYHVVSSSGKDSTAVLSHLRCSEVVVFQGSWKNLQIVFTPTFPR
jgi:hypothetical protein